MERKFFTIVRILGAFIASLSLLAVVSGGIMAYNQLTSAADTEIKTPQVEFSSFEKESAPSADGNEQNYEEDKSIQKNVVDGDTSDYEKQFDKYFTKIVDNINKYAEKYNVGTVNEEPLKNYLNGQLENYDADLALSYMHQLTTITAQLLTSPNAKNTITGEPMKWDELITWFNNKFQQQVSLEQERVQSEEMEAASDKIAGLTTLGVVGASLFVFMFFTMVLVLLRIESNTRKDAV